MIYLIYNVSLPNFNNIAEIAEQYSVMPLY